MVAVVGLGAGTGGELNELINELIAVVSCTALGCVEPGAAVVVAE